MKYLIAKKLFSTALSGFYSQVSVNGLEAIPSDQPVMFIANHCNAFVDPLLLASRLDRPVTFTAKNTLAKNPLLRLIIKSFSVELFSRRMDRGDDDKGKSFNQAALQRLENKLHNKCAVYIFPEGQSHNDTTLRDFKTGAAKLALSYGQNCPQLDGTSDLLIVPLGLHYSNKSAFRSEANIHVGQPLSLKAWLGENPNADSYALTDRFMSMVAGALESQKRLVRKKALTVQAQVLAPSLSARYRRWEKRVVGAPIAAFGWMLNALPFAITSFLVRMLSSDHDHPASAAIVVGPLVFAVVHCLQLVGLGVIGSGFLISLYVLMLIPSTLIALKAFDYVHNVGKTNNVMPVMHS